MNLTDQTVPQDVYTTLVELVERERASDARKGVEIAQILEGHIKRKTIKQTIMTTVYGVTRYGASLQIKKQLQGKLASDFSSKNIFIKSGLSIAVEGNLLSSFCNKNRRSCRKRHPVLK